MADSKILFTLLFGGILVINPFGMIKYAQMVKYPLQKKIVYNEVLGIKENCLVYGEISGNCAKCQTIDIKLDAEKCTKLVIPILSRKSRSIASSSKRPIEL